MLAEILFYVFITVSMVNVFHFGLYLVGANYYDVLKFKSDRTVIKKRRPRPLVSVLIPAYNEELSIIQCLESLRKNTYRKLQIIVIDDASSDETARLVKKYKEENPKLSIRLVSRRKNLGKAEALNYALKRIARGDLVMTLDADSILDRRAIGCAVKYFDRDPNIVGVAANVRIAESSSVLSLMQRFEYMVAYRSKKFFTITNCEFILGGVGSTYRADIMKKVRFYDNDILTEDIALSLKVVAQGNKLHRIVYGFDVVATTQGVPNIGALIKQRYRWKLGNLQSLIKYSRTVMKNKSQSSATLLYYRMPMAYIGEVMLLLEPIVFMYVIYVCLELMTMSLFIGAYMTITLYLFWTIFPDEHMTFKKKLGMASYAPVMYFILYIMNFVQLAAIFRCLWNYKKAFRKVKTSATWISPPRLEENQPAAT